MLASHMVLGAGLMVFLGDDRLLRLRVGWGALRLMQS